MIEKCLFSDMKGSLNRILILMKEQGVMAVDTEDLLEMPKDSFSDWKHRMGEAY